MIFINSVITYTLMNLNPEDFSDFFTPSLKGENLKNQHVPFRDQG
jgi:hypothetical protein